MRRMLTRVRQLVRRASPEARMLRFREEEPDGRAHLIVLARPRDLIEASELAVVGFFGQMRPDSPVEDKIWQADAALIDDFPRRPELLSYSSLLLSDGDWGDLALFATAAGMQDWARNSIHEAAVRRLAARHYASVRLHFGTVRGLRRMALTETLSVDYATSPPTRSRHRLDGIPS